MISGPLVVISRGRRLLVGLASYGYACDHGGNPRVGFYTAIQPVVDWIKQNSDYAEPPSTSGHFLIFNFILTAYKHLFWLKSTTKWSCVQNCQVFLGRKLIWYRITLVLIYRNGCFCILSTVKTSKAHNMWTRQIPNRENPQPKWGVYF